MAYEFRFPDVGEGITEGELLAWKVAEGDVVAEDQTLAEVETDKAVVELPSPRAGRVARLHVAEGDIVKVGDVVVTIEETAAAGGADSGAGAGADTGAAEPYTGSVVGRLEEAPAEEPAPAAAPTDAGAAAVLALPSVRALAKDLGVDLMQIRGTGPGGRILKQDVEDVAEAAAYGMAPAGVAARAPAPAAAVTRESPVEPAATDAPPTPSAAAEVPAAPVTAPALPGPAMGGVIEEDSYGQVERVPFRGVRRTMAKHMAEAVAKQAQVTTMDDADVTTIRHIRNKERAVAEERGVRLTYLAFVVKACTAALKRFPRLNAVLEDTGDEFLLKRYCNIGIAVDTKNGLVVPNIKAADQKSIFEIAGEIVGLSRRADERRLDLSDLHGGTFTISNYGAIGGTFATPVINYPEVALLGVGRGREMPIVREGQVVTRLMLPLSLTFDHRLIDGAEATRFLNLVIGYLEDPDLLLLEGD